MTTTFDHSDVDCPDGTCNPLEAAAYEAKQGYGGLDEVLELPNPANMLSLDQLVEEMDEEGQFLWNMLKEYENKYGTTELLKAATWFSPTQERSDYYEFHFQGPEYFDGWLSTGAYYKDGTYLTTSESTRNVGAAGDHFNCFRKEMVMYFKHTKPLSELKGQEAKAAETLKMALEMDQDFQSFMKNVGTALQVALTVAAIATGVGALAVATTRLAAGAAYLLIIMEGSNLVSYLNGSGENPLEEAIAYLGETAEPQNGEEIARTMFHMLNFSVGLKGKWAATAASIPLATQILQYQMVGEEE